MKEWKGTFAKHIRKVVIRGQQRFRVELGSTKLGTYRSKICKTDGEAIAVRDAWLRQGATVRGAERTTLADETPTTVEDGLAHYEMDLLRRGKSPENARRSSRQVIRAIELVWPEFTAKPLHIVTVDDVREFVRRRRTAGNADSTIARDFTGLRAMLKQTRPDLKIPAEVKPPDDDTRVRVLTPDQEAAVFPELAERFGDLFARIARLSLLTTLRCTEAGTLHRDMLHLPARVIMLKRQKGGTPRAVRLSDEAVRLLERQLAAHDAPYVFPNPRTNRPYHRSHISRTWRAARRACGIADFRFHDLRHHLPTLAANEGASTMTLQAIGGWKSAKMVARYAQILNPTIDHYLKLASRT